MFFSSAEANTSAVPAPFWICCDEDRRAVEVEVHRRCRVRVLELLPELGERVRERRRREHVDRSARRGVVLVSDEPRPSSCCRTRRARSRARARAPPHRRSSGCPHPHAPRDLGASSQRETSSQRSDERLEEAAGGLGRLEPPARDDVGRIGARPSARSPANDRCERVELGPGELGGGRAELDLQQELGAHVARVVAPAGAARRATRACPSAVARQIVRGGPAPGSEPRGSIERRGGERGRARGR